LIHQLVRDASQSSIAAHSPILLFDQEGIREVSHEETEHFVVTRDFLNHYSRRLDYLLGDD